MSKQYTAPGEKLTRHMSLEQVAAALKAQEQRRREEARRNAEEILRLVREQEFDDQEGRLWGEMGYEEVVCSWQVDKGRNREEYMLGVLNPYTETPETILLEKEWLAEVLERMATLSTTDQHFLEKCLQADSLEQIAHLSYRARPLPKIELLRKLWQMLGHVLGHEVVENLVDIAIFREESIKEGDNVVPRFEKRGDGRKVWLSQEARKLSLDALHEAIVAAGYTSTSRTGAARAKRQGWFIPNHHTKKTQETEVEASKEAKWRVVREVGGVSVADMETREIRETFGVSDHAAIRSKRRGYVYLSAGKDIPTARVENPIFRVYLTVEEKMWSGNQIGRTFGISGTAGFAAKKRGWFQVDSTNRHKVNVPVGRLVKI